jgi:hypothetical protein
MILGSKSLSQMSVDEMRLAIEELRASREALRNEALKDKAVREAKGITGEPRAKRERKAKEPTEADVLATEMIKLMRGE